MKKIFLVIKAEIEKQQKHDYHSAFVYLSLLIWPILGFLEVYYTYKPFSLTGYMGISDSKELLAFLGTGFMSYTCFWSMVQNAWSMANQERKGGTLEITFLSPCKPSGYDVWESTWRIDSGSMDVLLFLRIYSGLYKSNPIPQHTDFAIYFSFVATVFHNLGWNVEFHFYVFQRCFDHYGYF